MILAYCLVISSRSHDGLRSFELCLGSAIAGIARRGRKHGAPNILGRLFVRASGGKGNGDFRFWPYALMSCVAAAMLAGCGALRQAQDDMQPPIGAPAAMAQSHAINSTAAHDKTFEYTGSEQLFKAPAGATSIVIDALGAAGAEREKGYKGIPGHGGHVKATIPVKPGQTLRIFVGGSG